MKVSVIGTGYVGLVTGTCLSFLGSDVLCCDNNEGKINKLKRGIIPIYEPGLPEIFSKCCGKQLNFTTDIKEAAAHADVVFICVDTPTKKDNRCDTSRVLQAARSVASGINRYVVIVIKSTVPVGTARLVSGEIQKVLDSRGLSAVKTGGSCCFDVVSNPEFLREGSAVNDFMNPDRIVIGTDSERALNIMKELYKEITSKNTPVIETNSETAELIKYASNAFLAAKISFINEVADLCECCNADVRKVAEGMGLDKRIGPEFLKAGPGFGGSCFPKDVKALISMAGKHGVMARIAKCVLDVNEERKIQMAEKIIKLVDPDGIPAGLDGKPREVTPADGRPLDRTPQDGKPSDRKPVIGVLGLSFKPGTDDIRESPSIAIIMELLKKGAVIKVFDPRAMENTRKQYPDLDITYCSDIESACRNCDCVVLATEWDEFTGIDFDRLKRIVRRPVFIDLRNVYDPRKVKSFGFMYAGVGVK